MRRRVHRPERVILIALAFVWVIAALFPVWLVISGTFSSDSTNLTRVMFPNDIPNGISKIAYALTTVSIGSAIRDTLIYTVLAIVGMLITCSLAAYEFTYYRFPGKKMLFGIVMGTMMLPLVLYVIPLYRIVFSIGLADTYLGVALPLMASPLSVFILIQFMEDIPAEFVESAQVDGAGHFRTFFFVVLPLMRNGLITATVLLFLNVWGAFLWPSLVTGKNVHALSAMIANMFSQNFYVDPRVRFSAMLMAMIPPLVIYIVFQRHVIKGISMSGVKG